MAEFPDWVSVAFTPLEHCLRIRAILLQDRPIANELALISRRFAGDSRRWMICLLSIRMVNTTGINVGSPMSETRPFKVASFGPFKLDLKGGELYKDQTKIRLQEQPLQVLRMLVDHAGEVVTREEIRKKLWPNDTVVEFNDSINAAVKKLRLALGDSAEKPDYVETVARRGYRLLVAVEWVKAQQDVRYTEIQLGTKAPVSTSGNLIGRRVSHYRVLEVGRRGDGTGLYCGGY
jgi:DNA-binding winged helix-turn-helix (wHTH) protein